MAMSKDERRCRQRDRARERYNTDPAYREQMRTRNLVHGFLLRGRRRERVLDHYGRQCACCGESNEQFLTVDHMNGGGNEHRRQINNDLYGWLIRNCFPAGFQTLCYNCNSGKSHNGGICPHKGRRFHVISVPASWLDTHSLLAAA